ncbi:MAG: bifunctional hydroxymethylpyrimidine kinase/phosphomethylpyrimidine kinase [Fervidobacterium sp.]
MKKTLLNFANEISKVPKVLVIAGFDPSSGAGISLDIKVLRSIGCYSIVAITSLTIQNTSKVYNSQSVDPIFFEDQFRMIVEDVGKEDIKSVKIGLIGDLKIAQVLKSLLEEYKLKNVVFDPVLISTSGYNFTKNELFQFLKHEFLKVCDVITPNKIEAERIFEIVIPEDISDETVLKILEKMKKLGIKNCIVKGGHFLKNIAEDVLITEEETVRLSSKKMNLADEVHGTGCLFSSALAGYLAQNVQLRKAFKLTKIFVTKQIKQTLKIGNGKFVLNP